MRTPILIAGILSLAALLTGCEDKDAKSPYDVEVKQRSSALEIPKRVDRSTKRIRARESKALELIGKMPTAADKVTDPTDWEIVVQIVEASDDAGKDGGYAAEARDVQIAQAFFDEEKEEITKKVGGYVQGAAKQKGCEVDAYGAASAGLKAAIEERAEERLKNANDAFLIIDRNEDALGKKNRGALEDLAKNVAEASFTVHVEMAEAKKELEAMIKAGDEARDQIKKMQEEESAPPKEGTKPSAEAEKNKKERQKKAEERLALLDQAEADAKKNLEDLEKRTADLEKAYDDALSKLKDAIKAKKKPS